MKSVPGQNQQSLSGQKNANIWYFPVTHGESLKKEICSGVFLLKEILASKYFSCSIFRRWWRAPSIWTSLWNLLGFLLHTHYHVCIHKGSGRGHTAAHIVLSMCTHQTSPVWHSRRLAYTHTHVYLWTFGVMTDDSTTHEHTHTSKQKLGNWAVSAVALASTSTESTSTVHL